MVLNGIHNILARLGVISVSQEHVYQVVAGTVSAAQREGAVCTAAPSALRLNIFFGIPVCAELKRMGSDDTSEVIVDGRGPLIRAKTAAREGAFEVHVADIRYRTTPRGFIGYLVNLSAEKVRDCHSQATPAHRRRIGQLIGGVEACIREHGFVSRARAEHMSNVGHDHLRLQILIHGRRIRQRPRWSPPDADRMLVGFNLPAVGASYLGVVANCVINFPRCFPTVLGSTGRKLIVVPAISCAGANIGRRHQLGKDRSVWIPYRSRYARWSRSRRKVGSAWVVVGCAPHALELRGKSFSSTDHR